VNAVLVALAIAVQARIPVLLWGPPGTGKSSAVRQLGQVLGLPVETVIASIREPTDFAGLPVVGEGGVHFAPPSWAVRLAQAGNGILFLDELTTAPPAVQAALLRVVLERVVGDLELPPEVAVVAAANPPSQAAGGWDLSLPLTNRFVHLHWSVNATHWANGFASGWQVPVDLKLPAGWKAELPVAREVVAAFIRRRPSLLLRPPGDERNREVEELAWPSPRSWELAATALAAVQAVNASKAVCEHLVFGAVGEGAGREFLKALEEGKLRDVEQALRDPRRFRVPDRSDILHAFLEALCDRVIADLSGKESQHLWKTAWAILARVARLRSADAVAPFALRLAAAGEGTHELGPEAEALLRRLAGR